nr:glycosyltransferase [Methanobrevibacter smithii]
MIKINKNNIKISIVIPIYDNNNYVKDCLHSLLNQTLKQIEIVCINYCSDDWLKYFAGKNEHFQVFSKKKSENIINIINGEYVTFINQEDFFMFITFDALYDYVCINKCDMLFYPSGIITENKEILHDEYFEYSLLNSHKNQKDFMDYLFFSSHEITNILYNVSFLKKLNLSFPTDISFDNVYFFFKTFLSSNSIGFFDSIMAFKRKEMQPYYIKEDIKKEEYPIFGNDFCNYFFINNYDFSKIVFNKSYFDTLINIINLFDNLFLFNVVSRNLLNYICCFVKKSYICAENKNIIFNLIKHFFDEINNKHYMDFILNLDVENLIFYRMILKSQTNGEFILNYKIREVKMDKYSLEVSNGNLKNNIQELSSELNGIKQEVVLLNNKYNSINKEYNSLNKKYDSISTEYNSLNKEYDSISTEYNFLNKEYNSIKKDLIALRGRNRYLSLKNKKLFEENKELEEEIKLKITNSKSSWKKLINKFKS